MDPYYNGSTTIRLQPQDSMRDIGCGDFSSGPIAIFNNSLLAVTQTNGHLVLENHDAANPLAFSLKFWNSDLNILPSGNMNDGPIKDIQDISSVQMNTKDTPDDPTAAPPWNLTAYHDAALTYSFTGYRNSTVSPQALRFNYTQCATRSLAVYNGTIVGAQSSCSPNTSINSVPRVSGRFSNGSASLEIQGFYQGKSNQGSLVEGNVTINFNGTIDEIRSDRLVSNTHDSTPIWQSTLGYEKDLTGQRPPSQQGVGKTLEVGWSQLLGILALMALYRV
ncbi:uncharacterized protein N0V89_002621 [Didymosphaeria variabile]|uniref:Uncharacterized protein n=1 Tax=Didymosphaeria variabile TaxID=1932322 RepID=A0A9W9CEJ2_9PLEO|nr:uncharacterized protein N0V89_002621 [Didymosphaeria variabile]KAJ4358042.1 hypothetical protein N0V89_002621 [Didymosphaeria variabile]